MSKESYNPFKMWGAWIGAIIGLLFALNNLFIGGFGILAFIKGIILLPFIIIGAIFYMIIGFLVGWAIHSLIRKIKG